MKKELSFQQQITLTVSGSQNLEDVKAKLLPFLHLRKSRIGYVAGIITSEGPEHVQRNIQALVDHTRTLQSQRQDLDIFCSPYVFQDIWPSMQRSGATEDDYGDFWDMVIGKGVIQEIFFTPKWRKSEGAKREYFTAGRWSWITVHDLDLNGRLEQEV